MAEQTRSHTPVMCDEVLALLNPQPNENFLDLTLGGGGHAEAILRATQPEGLLYGLDRDEVALSCARRRLQHFGTRCSFFHANMSQVGHILQSIFPQQVQGALIDCGVSSFQIDDPQRGFSFQQTGPLDMRMNSQDEDTAWRIIRQLSEQALADIIFRYGEERFSRRIARAIKVALSARAVETTTDLAQVVAQAVPYRSRAMHPATRTFQALRIYINRELEEITQAITDLIALLSVGARLVVISFHSLEDRIVKNMFRDAAKIKRAQVLTKKPLRPSVQECQVNRRARSARVRGLKIVGLAA